MREAREAEHRRERAREVVPGRGMDDRRPCREAEQRRERAREATPRGRSDERERRGEAEQLRDRARDVASEWGSGNWESRTEPPRGRATGAIPKTSREHEPRPILVRADEPRDKSAKRPVRWADREEATSEGRNRPEHGVPERRQQPPEGGIYGIKFRITRPMPRDAIDPPPGACYNCWDPSHEKGKCPRSRAQFCENCGRRDTRVWDCPRCSEDYREFKARDQLRRDQKNFTRWLAKRRGIPITAGVRTTPAPRPSPKPVSTAVDNTVSALPSLPVATPPLPPAAAPPPAVAPPPPAAAVLPPPPAVAPPVLPPPEMPGPSGETDIQRCERMQALLKSLSHLPLAVQAQMMMAAFPAPTPPPKSGRSRSRSRKRRDHNDEK